MERFDATTFIETIFTAEGDSIAFRFGNEQGRVCMISMPLAAFRAWRFAAEEAQHQMDGGPKAKSN